MTLVAELSGLDDADPVAEPAPVLEDMRLAASGPRVDAMAGLIAPVLRTPSARLRAHRLEGAVVAVVVAWGAVGGMSALGWL
jgi:hypothetical protein